MALYPQARRAVEHASADLPVWSPDFDIEASRQAAQAEAATAPREDVAEVRELGVAGVRCRLYRPEDAANGLLLHLHGGGFVFHDIEVHDAVVRRLANRSGVAVLSVDYRLAPEHPFPAARDDVDAVVRWWREQAPDEGLTGPLLVHGDSAGGNLALVAALRHPGVFAAALLTYPFLDPRAEGASYRTATEGFDPAEAAWYWQQYAGGDADALDHPDLAPLLSTDLATLPPTLVVTAEHDPLRDEGELLALRLAELGVTVTGIRFLGQVHGFWRHVDVFDAAEPLTRTLAGFVRSHLG